MGKKLLLISNSTMAGEAYLGWPKTYISDFLNSEYSSTVLDSKETLYFCSDSY